MFWKAGFVTIVGRSAGLRRLLFPVGEAFAFDAGLDEVGAGSVFTEAFAAGFDTEALADGAESEAAGEAIVEEVEVGIFKLDDAAILHVMTQAKAHGALVCVHAENDAMIAAAKSSLIARGKTISRERLHRGVEPPPPVSTDTAALHIPDIYQRHEQARDLRRYDDKSHTPNHPIPFYRW